MPEYSVVFQVFQQRYGHTPPSTEMQKIWKIQIIRKMQKKRKPWEIWKIHIFRLLGIFHIITNSDLNRPCFAWHPYGKSGLFKTELVIEEMIGVKNRAYCLVLAEIVITLCY